jgi:4-hydroxy-tetrahydrodipicolinate synthase
MLDRQRRFDPAMNRDYLAFLDEGGADGVLVLGTTGEFASFSLAERKLILENFARNAGNLTLICHVGTSNVPETLELLEHAADTGADSALVIPPFYFKRPPLDGLIAYYTPILEAARIPVLVYNIPYLSGVPITVELVRSLSKFEKMAGMKDSHNRTEDHLVFIREFPQMRFLTGRTSVLSASLAAGGAGSITGSASVLLKETRSVYKAFSQGGDLDAAQESLNQAGAALRGLHGIPAMKYLLSLRGLPESFSRPPHVELSAEQKKKAAEAWSKLKS